MSASVDTSVTEGAARPSTDRTGVRSTVAPRLDGDAESAVDGDIDLLVIAGGGARRLGGIDKAMLEMPDGRTVLEATLAVPVAGRRVVIGPRRSVAAVDVWAQEQPPGGGPVAAIAAGLPWTSGPTVLVMAGDLPFAAGAAAPLLAALPGHDAAVVVARGRRQHLLAAWDRAALVAAVGRVGTPNGTAVRALFAGVDVVEVPDGGRGRAQWSGDLDTAGDVRRLLGPTALLDR